LVKLDSHRLNRLLISDWQAERVGNEPPEDQDWCSVRA
jgi:hypothetical protein